LLTIRQIADVLPLSRIATLQHGRALQAAGLLNGSRDSCEVFLTINKVFLLEVLEATTRHAEEAR